MMERDYLKRLLEETGKGDYSGTFQPSGHTDPAEELGCRAHARQPGVGQSSLGPWDSRECLGSADARLHP